MCNQAFDCRNFMKHHENKLFGKNTKCINEPDCFTSIDEPNKYFEAIN